MILLVAEEPSPANRPAFSLTEIPEWPGQGLEFRTAPRPKMACFVPPPPKKNTFDRCELCIALDVFLADISVATRVVLDSFFSG